MTQANTGEETILRVGTRNKKTGDETLVRGLASEIQINLQLFHFFLMILKPPKKQNLDV